MDEPRPTGSLVWHLSLRWRAAVDRAVAPLGLTHAQYSALASLRALTSLGEQPSQRRLAEYTGLGSIYVSKLVRVLERDGLVRRAPDPVDARALQLTLTDRGAETADAAVGIVRALDAELTASLGGPDSEATRQLGVVLQTLLQNAPTPANDPSKGEEP